MTQLGYEYKADSEIPIIGKESNIRLGTLIYNDVVIGDYFQTGHNALVRENTKIGNHVLVGTNTVIDGHSTIDDFVKIETNCYICSHSTIGSQVFIGPGVVFTNDKYPLKLRDTYKPVGPTIESNVTIGANVTICPGVTIGTGSFIGAGAVVAKDVAPHKLVKASKAEVVETPSYLDEVNMALNWKKHL